MTEHEVWERLVAVDSIPAEASELLFRLRNRFFHLEDQARKMALGNRPVTVELAHVVAALKRGDDIRLLLWALLEPKEEERT